MKDFKEKWEKEEKRNCHLKQWLKAEPHKNKKKYSRKDRRKYKNIDPDAET